MIFLVISFFINLALAGQPPAPDMRTLRWGMTRQEVRALERQPAARATDTTLLYRQRWFYNYPASLQLLFAQAQLAGARYLFTARHIRPQRHWDDFQEMATLLSERYGPPTGDYWTWETSLYKDRPDRYGDAVLLGHLTRSSVWETERTIITLEMSGKPKEGISTILFYSSKGRGETN